MEGLTYDGLTLLYYFNVFVPASVLSSSWSWRYASKRKTTKTAANKKPYPWDLFRIFLSDNLDNNLLWKNLVNLRHRQKFEFEFSWPFFFKNFIGGGGTDFGFWSAVGWGVVCLFFGIFAFLHLFFCANFFFILPKKLFLSSCVLLFLHASQVKRFCCAK